MSKSAASRLIAVVGATSLLWAATSGQSFALSDKQRAHVEYVHNCFVLLVKDPAAHATECGVMQTGPNMTVFLGTSQGYVPDAPPPKDECKPRFEKKKFGFDKKKFGFGAKTPKFGFGAKTPKFGGGPKTPKFGGGFKMGGR
jgi:hypothetical protein